MFEVAYTILDTIFGLSTEKVNLIHILVRAFFAYGIGLMLLFLNRRFIFELSAFDIIIKFTIGNVLADAIMGVVPYFKALVMVAFYVFLNWLLSFLSFHNKHIEKLLSGEIQILFEKGKIRRDIMKRNFITKEDVEHALRRKSIKSFDQVDSIYLEENGEVNIVFKENKNVKAK